MSLPESPYKGLRPFEDSDVDALLFFGRERESEVIAANLLAARLTVLYGPSGVGKSSVLRAGVAHRLRSDPEHVVVVFDAWSGDPVDGIAAAVQAGFGEEGREGSLAEFLHGWSEGAGREILLVLDQIEELFLYHGAAGRPGGLLDELPALVTEPGLRVNVLVGIREDALAQLDVFKGRIPNLFGNYVRLDRLDRESGRAAIVGPVERWNQLAGEDVAIDPELVEAVLGDVEAEPDRIEAPYLQIVLERIWDAERSAGSRVLRHDTLVELGGAHRIVDEHLERALGSLDEEARDTAAAMFAHLVTPSGTKVVHELGDLASYAGTDVRDVTNTLVRERILRPVDGGGDGAKVEIYHDVLAEAVGDWRTRHAAERRLRHERGRVRRLGGLAVVLLLALALMTGLAAYAFSKRGEAREQARSAQARGLAAGAASQLAVDPELSLLLALEASQEERTPGVEDTLRAALLASRVRSIARLGAPATAVAFGGHGRVAAAGEDGRVYVVDALTGKRLDRLGHGQRPHAVVLGPGGRSALTLSLSTGTDFVDVDDRGRKLLAAGSVPTAGAFSSDGARFATVGADGRLLVWDSATRTRLFDVRAGRGRRVEVDASGSLVAHAGGRRGAVFDVATGERLYPIEQPGEIVDLAFAPNGLLATAGRDGSARLWGRDGTLRNVLRGHFGPVLRVAFTQRGDMAVTASTDGTARVWRTATGELAAILVGHGNYVLDAAFSPDGGTVATASRDGTARLWRSDAGRPLMTLTGHRGAVRGVAFSPDGRLLATASEDGTARIWDAETEPELELVVRLGEALTGLRGGGGSLYGVGARTGDEHMIDWRARKYVGFSNGRPGEVRAVADRVTAIGGDMEILFRFADGAEERLRVFGGRVAALAFDQSGTRLAHAEASKAFVLELQGKKAVGVARLEGHRDLITSVSFSRDGTRVVTASRDHDARIWDARTGKLIRVLRGHFAIVSDAEFSPDGRWVVTAGPGTAGLWDAETGRLLAYLYGHEGILTSAAFDPSGRRIYTSGVDGTVRTFDCAVCVRLDGLVSLARERLERTGRRLTSAERRRYLGDG